MRFYRIRFSLFFAVICLSGSSALRAQERADLTRPRGASFWHAAAGVTLVNWVTWAYNWYVQRWPWANVGTESWGRNLRDGFVWDNDCFLDNQLAHPYQGSLYYNSARASGYGFWRSLPFVAAGSATWELFGENITASLNDLINTTFGGTAIGEVTYRLSSLIGSKQRRDPTFIGRELGAFGLSPVGRAETWLRGSSGEMAAAEPDRQASMFLGRPSSDAFFALGLRYGNPFDAEGTRPYDAFDFRLELGSGEHGIVRRVGISGLLARWDLSPVGQSRSVFGLFQHFDYQDLSSFRFSAQSLSGAVLYHHELGGRSSIDLGVHLEGILLGEISSDHGFEWRRDYDLGPGAGGRLNLSFARDGRDWVRLDGRLVWLHSLHGSDADHIASFVRLAGIVPMRGALGIGGDVGLITRHSMYQDFTPVVQHVPELRAYLTWTPS
ncbi:MAG TPA: DUF3943 domain-containing protein [Gemmatimonadales bacterium]|jgi:hypothetical protein|nr:DUF3943 domain-containing protein [Gemmatimonadales bacterium]